MNTYFNDNGKYQEEFDQLWKDLVPWAGEADTLEGEVVRSIGKISYEVYNNNCCNMLTQDLSDPIIKTFRNDYVGYMDNIEETFRNDYVGYMDNIEEYNGGIARERLETLLINKANDYITFDAFAQEFEPIMDAVILSVMYGMKKHTRKLSHTYKKN